MNTTTPRIAAWPTAKRGLDQWGLAGGEVRYLDATVDLDDLFLFEAKRRVMKDRTVSLDGRLYEVDALLVGHTVTLRYDPSVPPTRPLQVVHDGRAAGLATILVGSQIDLSGMGADVSQSTGVENGSVEVN